jgi:hypothetical protein
VAAEGRAAFQGHRDKLCRCGAAFTDRLTACHAVPRVCFQGPAHRHTSKNRMTADIMVGTWQAVGQTGVRQKCKFGGHAMHRCPEKTAVGMVAKVEIYREGRETRQTAWAPKGEEAEAKPSARHTKEAKLKQTNAGHKRHAHTRQGLDTPTQVSQGDRPTGNRGQPQTSRARGRAPEGTEATPTQNPQHVTEWREK